jgi:hypothetical protein
MKNYGIIMNKKIKMWKAALMTHLKIMCGKLRKTMKYIMIACNWAKIPI